MPMGRPTGRPYRKIGDFAKARDHGPGDLTTGRPLCIVFCSLARGACTIMKLTPWYLLITSLFITCLLTANIIAGKIADFGGGLFLPAAVIVFPISYIFGDVLTEVYGFRQARLTIWIG